MSCDQNNYLINYYYPLMVQIQRSEKKSVYRYLLQEGVIVLHKDFTNEPHKGTNVPNIHVRKLLRSLKDRGFLDLIFSWQTYYYLLNNEGKKHLSEELNLTEEVLPLTWKKDEKRQYEHFVDENRKKVRREREPGAPGGERRGGRGGPRGERRERREDTPAATTEPEAPTTA